MVLTYLKTRKQKGVVQKPIWRTKTDNRKKKRVGKWKGGKKLKIMPGKKVPRNGNSLLILAS